MMRFVPKYLARNSVSGLLSIFALFGSAKEPDVRKGIVKYLLVTARKPA